MQSLAQKLTVTDFPAEQLCEISQHGLAAQKVLSAKLREGEEQTGEPMSRPHLAQNFLVGGTGVIP